MGAARVRGPRVDLGSAVSGYGEAVKTTKAIDELVEKTWVEQENGQLADSELLEVLNYLRTVESHCSLFREVLTRRRLSRD